MKAGVSTPPDWFESTTFRRKEEPPTLFSKASTSFETSLSFLKYSERFDSNYKLAIPNAHNYHRIDRYVTGFLCLDTERESLWSNLSMSGSLSPL